MEVIKLHLEAVTATGASLARHQGKTVFVEGGAPNETAYCRIVKDHGTWAIAQLLEIDKPSPDRVTPPCSFYGECGGCNLQHIEYNAQLNIKSAILTEAFERIGGINVPPPQVFASFPFNYRNRMQFHCIRQRSDTNNSVRFGLKGKGSADIVVVNDCLISDPGIRECLKNQGKDVQLPPGKDRFTVYSRNDLFLNEGGNEQGKTVLLDKQVTVNAGVFFQSNGLMLECLIAHLINVAGSVEAKDTMADLYCGVGTFALFLGGRFAKVDLVEENKKALHIARQNLKGIDAEFLALRDTAWVKQTKQQYSFMVIDPPRTGLAPILASYLSEKGPQVLAYVSCNPASLARDSKILCAHNRYRLKELNMYDFYPQTSHIEALAVFVKQEMRNEKRKT